MDRDKRTHPDLLEGKEGEGMETVKPDGSGNAPGQDVEKSNEEAFEEEGAGIAAKE